MSQDTWATAFRPVGNWKSFASQLDHVDRELESCFDNLPPLLSTLPLDAWGAVLLDPERHLPTSAALLPRMPPDEVQNSWTGHHGATLLRQSLAFIRSLTAIAGDRLNDGPVLDYGVGWGRLSRLLMRHVPLDRLHGVDSWQPSLDAAAACNIRHPLRLVSTRLGKGELQPGYAVVYAFSVFTHLAPDAIVHNLRRLSEALRPGGHLVVTARPADLFAMSGYPHADPAKVDQVMTDGIVHVPSAGFVDYGDTAVSPDWMQATMRESGLVDITSDWNHCDPYQVIWSGRRPATSPVDTP